MLKRVIYNFLLILKHFLKELKNLDNLQNFYSILFLIMVFFKSILKNIRISKENEEKKDLYFCAKS